MSDIKDLEDGHEAAERVRKLLRSLVDGVDHKLAPDMVQVTGWGFGITIDGQDYVVGIEKV